MGMVLGYGLCSLFGLFYSAAHTIIPFILLGIGIDNIFVITQTFNTLEASSVPASLAQRYVYEPKKYECPTHPLNYHNRIRKL